jgi:hypothetical protein
MKREQFIGGLGIAVLDGLKNAGNVAQSATAINLPGVVPDNLASVPAKNHGPVAMFHRTMG